MITVGLVKELSFISKALKHPVTATLGLYDKEDFPKGRAVLKFIDNKMEVAYGGKCVWLEDVGSDDSFFGVESCDSLSRIFVCIDNKDESWRAKYPSPISVEDLD
jgi:hypothetical protein